MLKSVIRFTCLTVHIELLSVAAWSKAEVCGYSIAGVAGLKPSGDMAICLLCFLCFAGRSLVQGSPTECVCVCVCVLCCQVQH